MKKSFKLMSIICFIICICGCSMKSEKKDNKSAKAFDMKRAETTVNNYVWSLNQNDYEKAKTYFSEKLSKNYKENIDKNLMVTGGLITSRNQIGDSAILKTNITRTNISKPYCILDETTFKVIKENNSYKIQEITSKTLEEAFLKGNKIRLKKTNEVKDFLLLRKDSIPRYAVSSMDKGSKNKILVPLNNYGNINFSYSGDLITFSTYEENSYISLIRIDQSLATAGSDQDSQSNTGTDMGGTDTDAIIEKPVGKEINSLDILSSAKILYTEFSPDEQFVAVQYETKDKGRCIRVYDIDNFNIIPLKFEESFNTDYVNISIKKYEENMLIFDVSPKENAKDKELYKDMIGEWQLNLKNFKTEKM